MPLQTRFATGVFCHCGCCFERLAAVSSIRLVVVLSPCLPKLYQIAIRVNHQHIPASPRSRSRTFRLKP